MKITVDMEGVGFDAARLAARDIAMVVAGNIDRYELVIRYRPAPFGDRTGSPWEILESRVA